MNQTQFKVKDVTSGSAFTQYRNMMYGDTSLGHVAKCEMLLMLFNGMQGAAGLVLRRLFFPSMFAHIGKKTVFGRNLTLRHPHKIRIGDKVIIDDQVMLDAKGTTNDGVTIGNGVYIGRNTLIYCKNGNIRIEDNVNISSNCTIFSSHDLVIKKDTMIGAYSYILSGGTYDYTDATPFSKQNGTHADTPTVIGENCWLGARVTVIDGASVGSRCVIAAAAVVNKSLPDHVMAGGVPARVIKKLEPDNE